MLMWLCSFRGLTTSCMTIFHLCLSSTVSPLSAHPKSDVAQAARFQQYLGLFPSSSIYPFPHCVSKVCHIPFLYWFKLVPFEACRLKHPFICFFFCPWNPQYKSQAFHLKGIYSCLLCFSLGLYQVVTGHTKAFSNTLITMPVFDGLCCMHIFCLSPLTTLVYKKTFLKGV